MKLTGNEYCPPCLEFKNLFDEESWKRIQENYSSERERINVVIPIEDIGALAFSFYKIK